MITLLIIYFTGLTVTSLSAYAMAKLESSMQGVKFTALDALIMLFWPILLALIIIFNMQTLYFKTRNYIRAKRLSAGDNDSNV